MLTKSLHTITAATNVARDILRREKVLTGATAELIAADALAVLGYNFHPHSSEWDNDATLQRIRVACTKLVAERAKSERGSNGLADVDYPSRVALLQRQAG